MLRPAHHVDTDYISLGLAILEEGEERGDRTGTGTLSLFGQALKFDLRQGFPILTTKKVNFKAVADELLWFLAGSTNIENLESKFVWSPWADEDGNVGPVYGKQWRSWEGTIESGCCPPHLDPQPIDQIAALIKGLKESPESRRHIVSAWNVADLDKMALPPCHAFFQCYVSKGAFLDMAMYQRSADYCIGVPFNIASYALLMHMLAREVGLIPRYFTHMFGDVHIYKNHIDKFKEQAKRDIRPMPKLDFSGFPLDELVKRNNSWDFSLIGYDPHPFIKYEVAV